MKVCMNCMSQYEDWQEACPVCGYSGGGTEDGDLVLRPGSIIQKRYIVGLCRSENADECVYIGWDELFKRRVQIRELFMRDICIRCEDGMVMAEVQAQDFLEDAVRKFVRTGNDLIRLYREPDICTVFASFRENGTGYIVSEYLPQEASLADMEMPVPASEAKLLMRDILTALDKCHSSGLYADGLLPENVYRDGGKVILGGQRPDGERRKDIYGAVCLFCRMLFGPSWKPDPARTARQLRETEGIDDRLRDKIIFALETKKPELSVTARELKDALGSTGSYETLQLRLDRENGGGASLSGWPFCGRGRDRLLIAGALILALAAGGGAVLGIRAIGRLGAGTENGTALFQKATPSQAEETTTPVSALQGSEKKTDPLPSAGEDGREPSPEEGGEGSGQPEEVSWQEEPSEPSQAAPPPESLEAAQPSGAIETPPPSEASRPAQTGQVLPPPESSEQTVTEEAAIESAEETAAQAAGNQLGKETSANGADETTESPENRETTSTGSGPGGGPAAAGGGETEGANGPGTAREETKGPGEDDAGDVSIITIDE